MVNFSSEDVWLPPKAQLAVLSHFQCAENNPCEVRFQCISAKQEEVTGDQEFRPKSDSDTRELLSRLQIGGMS